MFFKKYVILKLRGRFMIYTFLITFCSIYAVFAIFVAYVVIKNCRKKINTDETKMTKNDFVIMFPRFLPIISWVCSLLCAAIIIFMSTIGYNETATWWIFAAFVIMDFLALFASYTTANILLIIKGDEITYYTAFGRKRILTFDDIASVKHYKQTVVCYNKDNKYIFDINYALIGYDLFMSRIRNKPNREKKKKSKS